MVSHTSHRSEIPISLIFFSLINTSQLMHECYINKTLYVSRRRRTIGINYSMGCYDDLHTFRRRRRKKMQKSITEVGRSRVKKRRKNHRVDSQSFYDGGNYDF